MRSLICPTCLRSTSTTHSTVPPTHSTPRIIKIYSTHTIFFVAVCLWFLCHPPPQSGPRLGLSSSLMDVLYRHSCAERVCVDHVRAGYDVAHYLLRYIVSFSCIFFLFKMDGGMEYAHGCSPCSAGCTQSWHVQERV